LRDSRWIRPGLFSLAAAPLGTAGLGWQIGGFAADPATDHSGVWQLVQAMTDFGGGSDTAENLNIAASSADTSQQTLLTTPHA
jgi:hypothetical protein